PALRDPELGAGLPVPDRRDHPAVAWPGRLHAAVAWPGRHHAGNGLPQAVFVRQVWDQRSAPVLPDDRLLRAELLLRGRSDRFRHRRILLQACGGELSGPTRFRRSDGAAALPPSSAETSSPSYIRARPLGTETAVSRSVPRRWAPRHHTVISGGSPAPA